MPEHQGFRISWSSQTSSSSELASIVYITETICTPFAERQFHLLDLLPPNNSHPRVLDNASGSGRQTEALRQAYAEAGKPIDITCCDISPGMIGEVKRRIKEGNWSNVKADVVNAEVHCPDYSYN